jgi:hypothetical protein
MKAHAQSQSFNDRYIKSIVGTQGIIFARLKESVPEDKHVLLELMFDTMIAFAKDLDDNIVAKRKADPNINWIDSNV